jgi:hypothetical protein
MKIKSLGINALRVTCCDLPYIFENIFQELSAFLTFAVGKSSTISSF